MLSSAGSCFGVNDVWYQKKEVYTFNMEDSSLGFIDQHHAAAVLPDEHNPSKDQGLKTRHVSSQYGQIFKEKCEHTFSEQRSVLPHIQRHVHEDP